MNNGFILCSLFHGENVYRKNFTDHLLISVFWYYLDGASHLNNKKYSDSELLDILRSSKPNIAGILTAAAFRKNGGKPTIAVFITRFGSWENACKLAGMKAGRGRSSYDRMHTKLQLLEFVEKYLSESNSNGSAKGYDDWQKNHPFAPSLALLRQRLGKWNDIKKQLSQFIN